MPPGPDSPKPAPPHPDDSAGARAAGPAISDPIARFQEWFAEARHARVPVPEAMALATADASGRPSVRMVLLKAVDARGFVFYTNLESPKAVDLLANPRAALCFHWVEMERQIRIEGTVEPVEDAEADAYFKTRPRLSQLGAWASRQSRPMAGAWELEKKVALVALAHPVGEIPRPPFWSGFRLRPERIEFWHQKPFRLHERVLCTKQAAGWTSQWLFP